MGPSRHGAHIQQSHKHSVPPLPSLKFPGTLTIFPEAAQVGGEEKAKSSSEAVSKGLTLLSISKGFPPLDSTNKYLMYLVYTEFYILKADTTISALWNPWPNSHSHIAFWLGKGACCPTDVMITSFPSPTPEKNVPQPKHHLGVLFGPYILFLGLT